MALIHCPECAGTVSDQAPVCPHCGFPLAGPVAAAPNAASADEGTASGISLDDPSKDSYPGKPYHWSDRVPVAFLLFWGGMLVGVMGSGGTMENLTGSGVQAADRTPIGWIAWGMVIGGILWFIGKNLRGYLYYRNWKINRLHKELTEEAERE